MKLFKVILGLGRLVNHHRKEYQIEATNEHLAGCEAKVRYYNDLYKEIGKDHVILGKMLFIESIVTLTQ